MTEALQNIITNEIPRNSTVAFFYADGSGAALFKIDTSGNLIDAEGQQVFLDAENGIQQEDVKEYLYQRCFFHFIQLPDDFKLFFELD